MAITPTVYATAAEYRAVTGRTDASQDAQILLDLEAVSRYLDARLGRFFGRDSADATRVYVAQTWTDTLRIDDLSAAPTSVTVDDDQDGDFADETPLSASDYELHPLNASLEPEPRPFTSIVLTPWGSRGRFRPGQRVQVVGRFGWLAVPQAIKGATIQLAAIWRAESPLATNRYPELDQAIEASPVARRLVWELAEHYSRRVGIA